MFIFYNESRVITSSSWFDGAIHYHPKPLPLHSTCPYINSDVDIYVTLKVIYDFYVNAFLNIFKIKANEIYQICNRDPKYGWRKT